MTPRILVADDSPFIREMLAAILKSCGYAVTVVEDGLAAWEEVNRELPDIIVLDIEMPHLDGCEVCRRLKNQPETRSIPVLMVSGCGETASRALDAGADGYLDKPFEMKDLEGRVHSLLNRNIQHQAAHA